MQVLLQIKFLPSSAALPAKMYFQDAECASVQLISRISVTPLKTILSKAVNTHLSLGTTECSVLTGRLSFLGCKVEHGSYHTWLVAAW